MLLYTSAEKLGLGALISDTFRLLRTHFKTFVLVTSVILLPLSLLDVALGQVSQPASVSNAINEILEGRVQWQSIEPILFSSWGWILAVGFLVNALVYPLLDGILVRMASESIRGRPRQLLEDVAYAARRWLRILGAKLLLVVAALVVLVLPFGCIIGLAASASLLRSSPADGPSPLAGPLLVLMVPMALIIFVVLIVIAVRLGLVTHAIIVEDQGAVAGIRRSWELTRGHVWQLIGYSIVLAIVVIPLEMIVGLFGTILPWLTTLNIGGWITTPFEVIANTLIFYGLRAHHERNTAALTPSVSASLGGQHSSISG